MMKLKLGQLTPERTEAIKSVFETMNSCTFKHGESVRIYKRSPLYVFPTKPTEPDTSF